MLTIYVRLARKPAFTKPHLFWVTLMIDPFRLPFHIISLNSCIRFTITRISFQAASVQKSWFLGVFPALYFNICFSLNFTELAVYSSNASTGTSLACMICFTNNELIWWLVRTNPTPRKLWKNKSVSVTINVSEAVGMQEGKCFYLFFNYVPFCLYPFIFSDWTEFNYLW